MRASWAPSSPIGAPKAQESSLVFPKGPESGDHIPESRESSAAFWSRSVKTLFLSHRIPFPPDKGDKIRSFHWLQHLARAGSLDLVTHVDDVRELRHAQVLSDLCREVRIFPLHPLVSRMRAGVSLLSKTPLSVAWLTRGRAKKLVAEWIDTRSYDLIFGYSSQIASYVPLHCRVPFLMDLVDVDSEKFAAYADAKNPLKKLIFGREAKTLLEIERDLGRRAQAVLIATARERDLYERRVGVGRSIALTNGVPRPDGMVPHAGRDRGLLLFSGTMDYPANIDAAIYGAREVLPRVRAEIPTARLRIVGRNPTAAVLDLARLPGVEVTGGVASMRPHLEEAAVALVALRLARGIQNKVLEALAHGLPVVATPAVLECMEPGAEGVVLAADSADQMAKEAVRLLKDAATCDQIGERARAYVAEQHDWDRLDRRLDQLIAELLQAASA